MIAYKDISVVRTSKLVEESNGCYLHTEYRAVTRVNGAEIESAPYRQRTTARRELHALIIGLWWPRPEFVERTPG